LITVRGVLFLIVILAPSPLPRPPPPSFYPLSEFKLLPSIFLLLYPPSRLSRLGMCPPLTFSRLKFPSIPSLPRSTRGVTRRFPRFFRRKVFMACGIFPACPSPLFPFFPPPLLVHCLRKRDFSTPFDSKIAGPLFKFRQSYLMVLPTTETPLDGRRVFLPRLLFHEAWIDLVFSLSYYSSYVL